MRRIESGQHEGRTPAGRTETVKHDRAESGQADVVLPPGSPDWISKELLKQTIEAWQPKSVAPLTADNALEILTLFGQLFEAVGLLNPELEDER